MLIKDIKNEEVRNLAIKRCREYSDKNAKYTDTEIGELRLCDVYTMDWEFTDEGYDYWWGINWAESGSLSQDSQTESLSSLLSDIEALREKVIKLMNK
jgi:hypothetical protein